MDRNHLAILGSTGSIGTQTLDVVRQHPDRLAVSMLSANRNAELLIRQALEFHPRHVVICDETRYGEVADALKGTGIQVHSGAPALCDVVADPEIDTVVAAMVGFSGLRPTLAAIRADKIIALANKETLVAAGALVMGLAAERQDRKSTR